MVDPTPATLDPAHADLLKEDGMVQGSVGTYAGLGTHAWTVQAIRFGDVTGAFAAFTFFRSPDMHAETVGDNAAASSRVFLVQSGATLVMVHPAAGDAMNPKAVLPGMRFLVSGLPHISGPSAIPPPLPGFLPKDGLDPVSVHYAIGPAGYNGPLPSAVLGFNDAAEVVTAAYRLPGSPGAVLTLAMLPTPELAEQSLRAIQALPAVHVQIRRFGTLLAVVSNADPRAAGALLVQVHYTPTVTAAVISPKPSNEVAKTAQLLVVVAEFTGLMAVCAVALAAFFGFGRVWLRRLRGKPDSSLNDESFITLRLK